MGTEWYGTILRLDNSFHNDTFSKCAKVTGIQIACKLLMCLHIAWRKVWTQISESKLSQLNFYDTLNILWANLLAQLCFLKLYLDWGSWFSSFSAIAIANGGSIAWVQIIFWNLLWRAVRQQSYGYTLLSKCFNL